MMIDTGILIRKKVKYSLQRDLCTGKTTEYETGVVVAVTEDYQQFLVLVESGGKTGKLRLVPNDYRTEMVFDV